MSTTMTQRGATICDFSELYRKHIVYCQNNIVYDCEYSNYNRNFVKFKMSEMVEINTEQQNMDKYFTSYEDLEVNSTSLFSI